MWEAMSAHSGEGRGSDGDGEKRRGRSGSGGHSRSGGHTGAQQGGAKSDSPTRGGPKSGAKSGGRSGGQATGTSRQAHTHGRSGAGGRSRVEDERAGSHRERREQDPRLPDEATVDLLDDRTRAALRGLGGVYERLGRHVVAVGLYLDEDPRRALAHARTARRLGSRVGLVREVAGIAAYHAGEYSEARKELLAARRMTGEADLLPMLADCERALGKPEAALAYLDDPLVARMEPESAVELEIVCSGALRDLGRSEEARVRLERCPELKAGVLTPASQRLWYAYAETLLATGESEQARRWFEQVATVDEDHETDAAERLARWDF